MYGHLNDTITKIDQISEISNYLFYFKRMEEIAPSPSLNSQLRRLLHKFPNYDNCTGNTMKTD